MKRGLLVALGVLLGAVLATGGLELGLRQRWLASSRSSLALYCGGAPRSRVLILGDSFARLYENESAFGDLLRAFFEKRGIMSRNVAKSGFGPPDYLRTLNEMMERCSPKLVLLNFYVGNDLTDTLRRAESSWSDSDWIAEETRPRPSWLKRLPSLASLDFLSDRWATLQAEREYGGWRKEEEADRPEGAPEILNPSWYGVARRTPDFHLLNLLVYNGRAMRGWRAVEATLLEIKRRTESANATLVIVAHPASLQVNEALFPFFRRLGLALDKAFLTTSVPQDLLRRFCDRHHIAFLDLLPEFRRQRERNFYWENDDHYNEAGNALAFRLTAAGLDERHLLDRLLPRDRP